MMIGPRQMAGASRSTRNPMDMSRTPWASSGWSRPPITTGLSKRPLIRGVLGPEMSPALRPARCPCAASATARFTATVDFPTPPLPELTAITRPRCAISLGAGAGTEPVDWGIAPGGPWVAVAVPAGSTTVILTPSASTPATALTALRASRTSVAGSWRESRKVNDTRPSGVTARSRIMPAERRSLSSRGFLMRPRAAATWASSGGAVTKSDRFHLPDLGDQLSEPRLDTLAQGDGGGAAAGAGPAQAEEQHAVGLVEVHHLHLAPVGGDGGPEGVQRLLDAFQRVGHRLSALGSRLPAVGFRQRADS